MVGLLQQAVVRVIDVLGGQGRGSSGEGLAVNEPSQGVVLIAVLLCDGSAAVQDGTAGGVSVAVVDVDLGIIQGCA